MKQITAACLFIVLIGSITSASAWAHGGGHYGGGWGGRYGGGWGGHYGGGWGGHHGGWGYGRGGYGYGFGGLGFGLGLGYGLGYYGGAYYPPYYPYPPAVITAPATPPVYIQQSPPVAQQYPNGYWYYCTNPEGYYPYIKECPNGWQQVNPVPTSPR